MKNERYEGAPRNRIGTSLPSSLGGAILFASALLHPACTGTEADNPIADPVDTTACKGSDDYVPLAWNPGGFEASGDWVEVPPARVGEETQSLSSLGEIPIWLECLEWSFVDGTLDYQIANFRGGCAIDWTGGANTTSTGNVTVQLQNERCAVAACGNCLYDLRSSGELDLELSDGVEEIHFELIRTNCDGDITSESSWTLPLAAQPAGLICGKADLWGAENASSNSGASVDLYAPCGPDAVTGACAEGLTCVDDSCVPACTETADCPLSRALECRDGYCQLPE